MSPGVALPSPEDVIGRQLANQSMGASAATPNLTEVNPAFRQAISVAASRNGGAVNSDALARHLRGQSLPVKVDYTEGQALQDPTLISNEMNARGGSKDLADRFNQQNTQLVQNLQALREQSGPDVFSTNPAEHGDTLIQAYQDKNAAAQSNISARYQALKDANGGQFPVDAPKLLDNVTQDLHQNLLFDHAPPKIMATLGRLADNDNMTFENYEALRTNLARIQRSMTADGNEKAAAGVIRNSMEQLPLQPEAAALKPLADNARSAARTQAQALEADPAYDAAVNETVPPDRFVNRFVIGAPRDDVATMRANLADNDTALQTMSVATLGALRDAARVTPDYTGNFSAPGYNKTLQALQPKIRSLVTPDIAEHLNNLGQVANDVKGQPAGAFVNNSNTFTSALAGAGRAGVEHFVPGGGLALKGVDLLMKRRNVQKSLAPGAGLDRLDMLKSAVDSYRK
jgi:hypothetical protein